MDWIVAVSASELARGACLLGTEHAAHAAFHEHGCVILRGAFPVAAVEAMHREYVTQCGWMDQATMQEFAAEPAPNRFHRVGDARYEITLRMAGVFATAPVFGNSLLLKLLGPLLGGNMHLSSFSAVVSHPGAGKQHAHRDHPHLYSGLGPDLPVYAVTVAVPLIDVDLATGPTGIWLGSHKWEEDPKVLHAPTVCPVRRGDCMLVDYRTMHAGLANTSDRARPILYLVYERPWFFDYGNHTRRIPLDMPLERYNATPASLRPLLTRAHSYAMYTCWHETTAREHARKARFAPQLVAQAPVDAWVHAGRNDPCPCGSGKKHKHCHGRIA
jgi:hypothetical protein